MPKPHGRPTDRPTVIHRLTSYCWYIFVCLLFAINAQAQTINISQLDLDHFDANDYIAQKTFQDQVDIQQVLALNNEGFIANEDQRPSIKLDTTSYWYRLDFANDTNEPQHLILQIDNPMIDHLALYTTKNGKVIKTEVLGDTTTQTNQLKSSLPNFELDFAVNGRYQVYINAYSQGSTIIPIILHDHKSFQQQIYITFLTWGAFIGIVLMMSIYNALLYMTIKDKIYVFYVGYILTMAVQLGIVYGYGFHLLPTSLHQWFSVHIVSLNYLISIFAILFALYFLGHDRRHSMAYRVGNIFCIILGFLGSATLLLPEFIAAKIYYPIQLLVYLMIGWITLPQLYLRHRWTIYYFISWIPLFIGTTTMQLLLLDLVQYNYWTHYMLLFGLVAEIGLISFALSDRFKSAEKRKIYNATHDSTTGLPNQMMLTECIGSEMANKRPFTLIVFEAERFSEIKPALGIIAANNLIKAIVDSVSDYFSAMDNLHVFEKDESKEYRLSQISDSRFGLLLAGQHDNEELTYIMLTIQEAVSTPIDVGGYNVSTSCCVGAISYPKVVASADAILQKAMYTVDIAKKDDSKFTFFSDEHQSEIQQQLNIVADLQQAIDHDLLEIYHQPQIDLVTQTICGNEALLRWFHPTHGFISPEIFITLAERAGIINQLTDWVIVRSLEQHAQILKAGFRQNISINLSAKDLTQSGLIAHIMTTIYDYDIDPDTIIFELTESATSDDPVHTLKTINQLHELNVKVAIDDFGTGYSSLEYISKLPFHELKVDKSFVMDILNSKRDQAITKTTIELAKNLGIFVVAEGVESLEIEQLLRSYQCEIGQGYYYSKPLPMAAYLDWLANNGRYQMSAK